MFGRNTVSVFMHQKFDDSVMVVRWNKIQFFFYSSLNCGVRNVDLMQLIRFCKVSIHIIYGFKA